MSSYSPFVAYGASGPGIRFKPQLCHRLSNTRSLAHRAREETAEIMFFNPNDLIVRKNWILSNPWRSRVVIKFPCVKRILMFVGKKMVASEKQVTRSVSFSLTACQQLLLHTRDWLGLKSLRVDTPRVPHGDVSLLHPAMHPQYVTVTQQILSLKFSAAYKRQCRGDGEWIKQHFCSTCWLMRWVASSGSLGEGRDYHRLVMASFPTRRHSMSDSHTLPHWSWDWPWCPSKLVCEQKSSSIPLLSNKLLTPRVQQYPIPILSVHQTSAYSSWSLWHSLWLLNPSPGFPAPLTCSWHKRRQT